jgi:recombination protein RecA
MKAEEKLKLAHEAKESVNKSLGKNTVMSLSDKPSNDVEVISTGSLGLDIALGVGGLPKGRIIEIYGPESCLDKDSFIPYEIWDKDCVKRVNHKGGSIKRLYERFHNVDVGEAKQGRHLQKKDIKIFVKSVNHENCIVRNEVLDVVRTGRKECYKISTSHGDIIATADHKFMTPQGFIKLSDLRFGDYVYIHNNTRNRGRKKYAGRPEIYVKYHPKLPVKLVDKYVYHRGQMSRLTYEAYLNKCSLKEYIKKLNNLSKEEIQNLIFLPDNMHVHHIDENFANNDISNLQLISPSDHGKLHAKDRIANLSYTAVPVTITDIQRIGIRETYDIKCAFPYNNYIADGYVVHNCGKTTLAIHVIVEAQKSGGICAIIDAEHAFDSIYAESLGVDLDRLFINQPDFGEQGLEVADKLIGSGAYDVVVIDSVAALVPKAELEGEMGDSKMGLHARLMSQACRKLTSVISKTNTICIFINQLRDKIGVMYGCLHADMPIIFTDGRKFPIKKVVENQIQGDVWCFNEKTNLIESKPIIDWHYNGDVKNIEDFIHIETTSIDGKGRFGITVTPNHKIMTINGWVEASKINVNDYLLSKYESILINKATEDFLKGCLVGDSTIRIRSKNTGSLKLQDSNNQDYCDWKKNILSKCISFKKNNNRWESEFNYEFAKLKKEIENRNPLKVFKDSIISDLSLAIWIMDDGNYQISHKRYCLSIKRFKNNTDVLEQIKSLFLNNNLDCNYSKKGNFTFTVKSSKDIAKKIAPYIYSSMKYKLPVDFIINNKFDFNSEIQGGKIIKSDTVLVLSKRICSDRQFRQKGKYDISIEGNHNYFSGGYRNGVLVHNSPETTTGGNALKFYASVRLDVRRSTTKDNSIIENSEVLGNLTRVSVIKNKVASPFKKCEFNILYGEGIDKINEIVRLANDLEIIKKWGKTITYLDVKYDVPTFEGLLKDNPDFYNDLRQQILTKTIHHV